MPKHREAKVQHCSFCGTHKDGVPLLIASAVTKAAVCSTCALAVIEQTFALMNKMEAVIRQAQNPVNPMKIIVPEDKTDAAIGKATGNENIISS